MTLRDLTYLIMILQEGSFSKAASRLFISQSALSQAVAKLEKSIDLQLFIRNNTSIKPTEACRILCRDGEEILAQWDMLETKIQHMRKTGQSVLRVGMPALLIQNLLPHVAPEFRRRYPAIALEILEETSDHVEDMVSKGVFDLGCVQMPLKDASLKAEYLFDDCIFLAVPAAHPFNQKHPCPQGDHFATIDLSELKNEQFLIIRNRRSNAMFKELFEAYGFEPKILRELTRWNVLHDFVERGMCIGFERGQCIAHNRSDRICYYRINSEKARRRYVAVHSCAGKLPFAATNLINIIREYAKTLPGVYC